MRPAVERLVSPWGMVEFEVQLIDALTDKRFKDDGGDAGADCPFEAALWAASRLAPVPLWRLLTLPP